jgi:hypothetical protein
MQKFVAVRSVKPGDLFYIAVDMISEIGWTNGKVKTRDGRVVTLLDENDVEALVAGDIIRGALLTGREYVAVPVSSIDHVVDRYDEASREWVAIATTRGGVEFLCDSASRQRLRLNDEIFDADLLDVGARLGGELPVDREAEAAVDEAEAGPVRKTA